MVGADLGSMGKETELILIGASFGGLQAIAEVLSRLTQDTPPIALVLHMDSEHHLGSYLNRLDGHVSIGTRVAVHGELLAPGTAVFAPANRHLRLRRGRGGWQARVSDGPKVSFCRPAVDVLFASVADVGAERVAGAVLTGMGSDGAEGLLALRKAGARTIAQDEATSAMFGMPKCAAEMGGAERVLPLEQIGPALVGRTLPSLSRQVLRGTPRVLAGIGSRLARVNEDHAALYRFADDLHRLVQRQPGQLEVREILRQMALYADRHFKREEALMRATFCSTERENAMEHRLFWRRLGQFEGRLASGEDPAAIATSVDVYVLRWLKHHVGVVDAALQEVVAA